MKILTADEATASILLMTEKFQDAMKAIENNKGIFDALFKEFTLLKQKFEEISADHKGLKDSSTQALSALDSKNMGLYSDLSSTVSTVSKFAESCAEVSETFKNELQVLKEGLSKLSEKHTELLKNSSSNIVSLSTEIEDVKMTLVNFVTKFEDADKSNKGAHADLKNFVNTLANDLISAKGNLREFIGATSGFQKDLASHKEATASQFEQLNHSLMIHIEDKLAALPKPSIAPTISPDDAKALVQKQVEPASLDAKNANLRSSNNEQKITMLEKKVETLQLLLNKMQISQ